MSRLAEKDKIIYFDINSFKKDLRNELKEVTIKGRNLLVDMLKEKILSLPLKHNTVRLAGGGETSDYDRLNDLLESVVSDRVSVISDCYIETAVYAMKNNFENSHIGIYYEYGTGEYAEDVSWVKNLGDPNPYRSGREIVSRSKKDGLWRDAGGNVRITGSPLGGGYGEKFRDYIGNDIQPLHWFEYTFNDFVKNYLMPEYSKTIKKVNPLKYISVKRKFVIGRD